ncbi:hypothetical protein CPB85DRAFT_376842 [Mucidula mucida]|nr:hypothetical protein CPB85DRAFT_376842 [Mucidula mucida]
MRVRRADCSVSSEDHDPARQGFRDAIIASYSRSSSPRTGPAKPQLRLIPQNMSSPVQCQKCGARVVGARTLMPVSDLQRIHRSGPYLPAPEMRKYQETLSDVQADITTLQTVIAELEAYASQIRTIVSPIRFVPMRYCVSSSRRSVRTRPPKRGSRPWC